MGVESELNVAEKAPLLSEPGTNATEALYPKELPGLRFIRVAAALHICLYHWKVVPYGRSWLCFFFLLSGFGASFAKLHRAEEVATIWPQPKTLLRRWASIYPTYLCALLVAVVVQQYNNHSMWWGPFAAEVLMVQELFFGQDSKSKGTLYNTPGWYCSALVLCWLLEEPCFAANRWLSQRGLGGFLIAVVAIALWLWSTLQVSLLDEVWYLGVYSFGSTLAHYLYLGPTVPLVVNISASTAALALAAMYVLVMEHVSATARQWCLLPLQSLLIYGLARGKDPLARLLSVWPLPAVSDYALGLYLLHMPVGNICRILGWQLGQLVYDVGIKLAVTLPLVVAAEHLVQQPLGRRLRRLF